jgi:hypothetical protein
LTTIVSSTTDALNAGNSRIVFASASAATTVKVNGAPTRASNAPRSRPTSATVVVMSHSANALAWGLMRTDQLI